MRIAAKNGDEFSPAFNIDTRVALVCAQHEFAEYQALLLKWRMIMHNKTL